MFVSRAVVLGVMTSVVTTLSLLAISLCTSAFAQVPACTRQLSVVIPDMPSLRNEGVDVTVRILEKSVIMPRGVGDSDLTASDVSAHAKKRPVTIRSLAVDRGPRRIVFVVENGKRINATARRIEAAVLAGIVSKARPRDSFALISAGGERLELPFGSSREAVLAVAEQLKDAASGKVKGLSALDAVHEATNWLGPSQAGDSIYVMAFNLEGRSRTSFSTVGEALSSRGIRLFGLELGYVTQPNPESLESASLIGGYLSFSHAPVGNVDTLIHLSMDSGGAFAWENTTQGKNKGIEPAKLERLVAAAQAMYQAAVAYYVVELDCSDRDVAIGLSPTVRERFPGALLLYPR